MLFPKHWVVLTNTCLETPVSSFSSRQSLQDFLLLLLVLRQQNGVDVGKHTSSWDDRVAEHLAQLFVVSHCKHQVARVNRLSLVVSARVSCEFDNFSHQVFQDCSHEDSGSWGTTLAVVSFSKVASHSSDGERKSGAGAFRLALALSFSFSFSFGHLVLEVFCCPGVKTTNLLEPVSLTRSNVEFFEPKIL